MLTIGCLHLLAGCSTASYYGQAAQGHLQLLQQREPIEQVLNDPSRDEKLQQRLALALQARQFASSQLGLPDNQSYRLYADIQRPVVMWNLFITPEFSLAPQLQCFPVAGCVAYRGFYDLDRARGAAATEQLAGMDIWIGGVEAYSTLGWFDDPILSSMLQRDDQQLAAVIFHELAHQQLYVSDDTAFNESFASFVEQEGLRQWLASRGELPADPSRSCRREQFVALVMATRVRLEALYGSDQPPVQMRQAKQAEFERMRKAYRQMNHPKDPRIEAWMAGLMSNAKLLPFGLYDQWVAGLAELFQQSGQSWARFYLRVQSLADVAPAERQRRLLELMPAVEAPCAVMDDA
jgi:predicted aminopeptidase